MSRHAKKRRCTDATLSSLAQNTHRHEILSSRVVSTVRRQSTSIFGGIAADNNNAIDRLSPSDDSDEDNGQKSPLSPCFLPVVKSTNSPYEVYHNEQPLSSCLFPVLVPTSVSKEVDKVGKDEDEKCERKCLDVRSKTNYVQSVID